MLSRLSVITGVIGAVAWAFWFVIFELPIVLIFTAGAAGGGPNTGPIGLGSLGRSNKAPVP